MLAHLYHAEEVCGTATVGSSEAILLGGLAMKRRWQARAAQGPLITRGADMQGKPCQHDEDPIYAVTRRGEYNFYSEVHPGRTLTFLVATSLPVL